MKMVGKQEVDEAINTALTFLGLESSSVAMISVLWALVPHPQPPNLQPPVLRMKNYRIALDVLTQNPSVPSNARLAAKGHIPSPLGLTSLVSLHHAKSLFLPSADVCLLEFSENIVLCPLLYVAFILFIS